MYNRFEIFSAIGLDNLYPSVAFNFHATVFKHGVNKRGHNASPWGRSFLNLIISDCSWSRLVRAIIRVFQVLVRLLIVLHIHGENRWIVIILKSHLWDTESYALRTSIHAMLKLRFLLESEGKSCRPENNNYSQAIYMSWPLSVKHAAKTTFAQ